MEWLVWLWFLYAQRTGWQMAASLITATNGIASLPSAMLVHGYTSVRLHTSCCNGAPHCIAGGCRQRRETLEGSVLPDESQEYLDVT